MQLGYLLAKAHALGDSEFNASVVPYSFEDELLAAVGDDSKSFLEQARAAEGRTAPLTCWSGCGLWRGVR